MGVHRIEDMETVMICITDSNFVEMDLILFFFDRLTIN